MAWRARQRSENRRAGGLKGRDRGWLPGSTQANAIGIPHNLVNKTRERTNTLVTREAAANIAGGVLTEPLPDDFGDGEILIDTRSLVVNTNQLGGIGRFRSQFNVDADGIKHARYYLPIYPKDYFKKSIGDCNTICEKARPNSVISVYSYNELPGEIHSGAATVKLDNTFIINNNTIDLLLDTTIDLDNDNFRFFAVNLSNLKAYVSPALYGVIKKDEIFIYRMAIINTSTETKFYNLTTTSNNSNDWYIDIFYSGTSNNILPSTQIEVNPNEPFKFYAVVHPFSPLSRDTLLTSNVNITSVNTPELVENIQLLTLYDYIGDLEN
jgi:hypothetical protein